MWLLDHTCATPAENIALDEVLLNRAEADRLGEGLRLWESPELFVVLGLSQAVEDHVNRAACAADNVPILRRCSAGGCVLQGPGCLNFSLVLRIDRPGCQSITSSYRTILTAISATLGGLGRQVTMAGISDLALGDRKISGNAQRRRTRFFLHHGTLLLDFDLARCSKYLQEPPDQPEYRNHRSHECFIANINLPRTSVATDVSRVFQAMKMLPFSQELQTDTLRLVAEKYAQPTWNFRR